MTSSTTPASMQAQAVAKAVAEKLWNLARPTLVVDTTHGASGVGAALRDHALSQGHVLRLHAQAEMPADQVIDLVLAEGALEANLARWRDGLADNGLLLLDLPSASPPAADAAWHVHDMGDGRHWVLQRRRAPISGLSPARTEAVDTAQAALALVRDQRLNLEQATHLLASREAELQEAIAQTRRAEHKIVSLKRALEANELSLKAAQHHLHEARSQIALIMRSRSWKLTAPLRFGNALAARTLRLLRRVAQLTKATVRTMRTQGPSEALRRARQHLSHPDGGTLMDVLRGQQNWRLKPVYPLPPPRPALSSQQQRVLLVAETGLAQCLKYRVMQKQQMIRDLGIDCTVINWTDTVSTRDLLQTHNVAIFYRVPGYKDQLETIALAQSMGVHTFWEVDDLIFDLDHYRNNSNLQHLTAATRKSVLQGVPLYRKAMLACDSCIASTAALAQAMMEAGARHVEVVENALDFETLRAAEEVAAQPLRGDGLIRIVYGSGSLAHDHDFRQAAPALLRILKARYDVRLTIIGNLNLPAEFKEVDAQVERLPASDYITYMKRLAKCDINIAPLEDSVFNDAKSNIKYLEAAILGLPSICSPTTEYRQTIQHGETGLLAATPEEWETHLLALIANPALRSRIGANARRHVEEDYTPEAIGERRVRPVLAPLRRFEARKPRVLGVNIFFEPRSFGGATIVAEQLARLINQAGQVEYGMFTSLPTTDVHAYKVVRYESSAAEVFAMGIPHEHDPALQFDNPYPTGAFREILRAWRPDVVHIHSIQGIGVQIAEVCQQEGVPFVVTLHDAWWICARQFMVNNEGRYCYQRKVDLDVCAKCVPHPALNPLRQHRLHEVLSGASLLMSPSQFFRGIYEDNAFDPDRLVVNKNGIARPLAPPARSLPSQRPLRFGFVGGEGPIKGSALIKKALRELPQHTHYELHVVDNELNLGRRSIFEANWQIPGQFKAVPAYTQDTIDDFFGSIDVLLFPTQWKESFGLSVREALIRDVWVIATDAGGVIEDIVDGENGNIIPLTDDGSALKAAIQRLLERPGQLDGYRNPHAGLVRLFEEQAAELTGYLLEVARQAPVNWRAPNDLPY